VQRSNTKEHLVLLNPPNPLCEDIVKVAREFIARFPDTTAAVGSTALAHFGHALFGNRNGSLAFLSTSFDTDVLALIDHLNQIQCGSHMGHRIAWTRYHPFLEFFEERVEGSIDGHVVITVFRGSQTVPSCGCAPDGLRIASFTQTLLIMRAMHLWHLIHDTGMQRAYMYKGLIDCMLSLRAKCSPTDVVGESSKLREFFLEFIGTPQRTMRVHMKKTDERMHSDMPKIHTARRNGNNKRNECAWFSYDPRKVSPEQSRFLCRRTFPVIDGTIKLL
jgi:hypothetical protein